MTESSTSDIILKYVIPSFGVIMGNIMFMAPVKDVYIAVKAGNGLGTLNPIPWAFTLGNCIGWLTYSVLKQDVFLFVGNGPGLCIAVWLNLQAVKLQYHSIYMQQTRQSIIHAIEESEYIQQYTSTDFLLNSNSNSIRNDSAENGGPHENNLKTNGAEVDNENSNNKNNGATTTDTNYLTNAISKIVLTATAPAMIAPAHQDKLALFNVIVWLCVIGLISFATTLITETRDLIVGVIVNLNLFVFYAAPLSVIYTVISQRNSAYIHICTMCTNTLNGTFWAIYGLAMLDPFIYICNGLGAVLGLIQIVLCIVYPRKQNEKGRTIPVVPVKTSGTSSHDHHETTKANMDVEEQKLSAEDGQKQ